MRIFCDQSTYDSMGYNSLNIVFPPNDTISDEGVNIEKDKKKDKENSETVQVSNAAKMKIAYPGLFSSDYSEEHSYAVMQFTVSSQSSVFAGGKGYPSNVEFGYGFYIAFSIEKKDFKVASDFLGDLKKESVNYTTKLTKIGLTNFSESEEGKKVDEDMEQAMTQQSPDLIRKAYSDMKAAIKANPQLMISSVVAISDDNILIDN